MLFMLLHVLRLVTVLDAAPHIALPGWSIPPFPYTLPPLVAAAEAKLRRCATCPKCGHLWGGTPVLACSILLCLPAESHLLQLQGECAACAGPRVHDALGLACT